MNFIKNKIDAAIDKRDLITALEQMHNDLVKLGDVPGPHGVEIYDYAVSFFNITTSFADKYMAQKSIAKFLRGTDAHRLNNCIRITGARFDGLVGVPSVHAKAGDRVSLQNLYLEMPDYVLTSQSAEYYKKHQDFRVQYKLTDFIKCYRNQMIASLSRLIQSNKKPDNFIIRRALEQRRQIIK